MRSTNALSAYPTADLIVLDAAQSRRNLRTEKSAPRGRFVRRMLEATGGFEPPIGVLQFSLRRHGPWLPMSVDAFLYLSWAATRGFDTAW